MEVPLPAAAKTTLALLRFSPISLRMSLADCLQYVMSLSACDWTWVTKLMANGMVTHTERMATSEKVTAE
jgi:hypothetical protein